MKFTSQVFSAVSGSMGGTTFAHNKGGMYTRARGVPTNPNTVRQQAQRSLFGAAVVAWSTLLSSAQRAAWNTYGENVTVTDSLGQPRKRSGQQWFIGSYTLRFNPQYTSSGMQTLDAPAIFDRGPDIIGVKPMEGDEEWTIGVYETSLDLQTEFRLSDAVGETMRQLIIYRGHAQNPGVTFYKGPYRLSGVVEVSTAVEFMEWTGAQSGLLDGFPAMEAGQNIPLKVVLVHADGRYTSPLRVLLPVVEDTSP